MNLEDGILRYEGNTFPGKTFAEVVLEPAYNNAKAYLLDFMLVVNKAHLIMLVEQSLLSKEDGSAIANAISQLNVEELRCGSYTGLFEDLFFEIESLIIQNAGDIGGNIHLARSRNDIGVAIYRLALRSKIQSVILSLLDFQKKLLHLANEHKDTVMLGYTHTQQAQPTTLAHYLLAVFDSVSRDERRFMATYQTVNASPLGAAAMTTTGFRIDRTRTANLLGFDGLVENSYDAIAGADYLGQTATTVQLCLLGIGRYAQDFLLWATQEFGGIRIADPYVQISSIMPQKRNPVSLEHIRALSSGGIGRAGAVITMLHNTPFGDINDTEDDLQPHLWQCLELTERVFRLFGVVIGTMQVNRQCLLQRAVTSLASITELADRLVRDARLPFRTAHEITSIVAKKAMERGLDATGINARMVDSAAMQVVGRPLCLTDAQVREAMDPTAFIAARHILGGPSPLETHRAIEERSATLHKTIEQTQQEMSRINSCMVELDRTLDSWREEN